MNRFGFGYGDSQYRLMLSEYFVKWRPGKAFLPPQRILQAYLTVSFSKMVTTVLLVDDFTARCH